MTAAALPALADNPAPSVAPTAQRIRGKIEAYDPATRMLNITTIDKKPILVALEPDVRVIYDARLKLTDIKQGDFIGSTTLRMADGKLRAQEVHVFPDAMRGAGEGQYPASDANPNRLLTNATVAEVASVAANKGSIKLTYRGAAAAADGTCSGRAASGAGCTGSAEIVIVPGIPVIAIMLGDESLLVPGAAVSVSAMSAAGGTFQSSRLTVEKDGVKPIL
jgi:hypothetical protein